jgi:hypothetical protein
MFFFLLTEPNALVALVLVRHQIESPKRAPRESAQGRLAALGVQKFVPFIWIFQTVRVPRWW